MNYLPEKAQCFGLLTKNFASFVGSEVSASLYGYAINC